MIGIRGNYLLFFDLAGRKDFIAEADLLDFTLIEEAGNVLPTFSIEFTTKDDSILKVINEGNDLNVSFGGNLDDITTVPLKFTRLQPLRSGEGKMLIRGIGIYSALPYINDDKIAISPARSGVTEIQNVVSKYFKTEFNVTTSVDSQKWIQHNISDRNHINNVWMRINLNNNSFPIIGISSSGKFILKDVKQDLKQPVSWRFIQKKDGNDRKDIIYDGDPAYDFNTGFINNWVGYGREQIIYDIEQGVDTFNTFNPSPVTALTSKLSRDPLVGKRFGSIGFKNANTHSQYAESRQRNIASLASFSANKVLLSFRNVFRPVKVLDRVMFKDVTSTGASTQSSEYLSGEHYISKVVRQITNRQFITTVEICRESINSVRSP